MTQVLKLTVICHTVILQKKNWTGLILASRNGYAGIVRRLLDKGADVNKETDVIR